VLDGGVVGQPDRDAACEDRGACLVEPQRAAGVGGNREGSSGGRRRRARLRRALLGLFAAGDHGGRHRRGDEQEACEHDEARSARGARELGVADAPPGEKHRPDGQQAASDVEGDLARCCSEHQTT
jgi:hypothetical protein